MTVDKQLTRTQLERQISGALKSCIDAHGPVTREWTGSAAKRIIGLLKANGVFVDDEAVVESE